MSRHSFETTYQGRPVCVTIGFDAPLGYYHALIEFLDTTDDDESPYLYSNLDDSDPFPRDVEVYRRKFRELGIELPERMFREAKEDGRRNIVNRVVDYARDGRMIERSPGYPRAGGPVVDAALH